MKTETPSESRALPVAAHTPGPWTSYVMEDGNFGINGRHPVKGFQPESECWLATVHPVEGTSANARLISSAPELLALLQDVGQWLEAGLSRGQISRGTANRDGDLVSQIRAAILKAKGQANAL